PRHRLRPLPHQRPARADASRPAHQPERQRRTLRPRRGVHLERPPRRARRLPDRRRGGLAPEPRLRRDRPRHRAAPPARLRLHPPRRARQRPPRRPRRTALTGPEPIPPAMTRSPMTLRALLLVFLAAG